MNPGWGRVLVLVARSALVTLGMLVRGRIRQPRERVGSAVVFPDGTRSVVFRETRVANGSRRQPVVLVVEFRLRFIGPSGRVLHAAFRRLCVINTPLFAGFHGFSTKLWMVDPETSGYRGLYQWDGAEEAEVYASALAKILRPLCARGSVRWTVLPGLVLEDYLAGLRQPGPTSRPSREDAVVG